MVDYGGTDRRKTKGDLKRKAKNRVYKRGGQFRTSSISETEINAKRDQMGNLIDDKGKKKKSKGNRKY